MRCNLHWTSLNEGNGEEGADGNLGQHVGPEYSLGYCLQLCHKKMMRYELVILIVG
jgi:hypothetical protein